MRFVIVTMFLVCVAGWALADLEGSVVELVDPVYDVGPDETYTFIFRVSRDMSSTEVLTEVLIIFYPVSLTLLGDTMGYDEIEPGRPSFEQINVSGAAHWRETVDTGGVHAGESTLLWIDVHTGEDTPPWSKGLIGWSVLGASGGQNGGYFYFYTPVRLGTWGAIKALYN